MSSPLAGLSRYQAFWFFIFDYLHRGRDLLALRSRRALPRELVAKICRASTLPYGRVVNLPDVRSLYRVPGALLEGGAVAAALEGLRLNCMPPDALPDWDRLAALDEAGPPLRVALVGKYTAHADAYLSVREALRHAALARGRGDLQ